MALNEIGVHLCHTVYLQCHAGCSIIQLKIVCIFAIIEMLLKVWSCSINIFMQNFYIEYLMCSYFCILL